MEKSELKTGQLLGIVEKNGKLVREYVAGFFGEEPIIKQRLLTPQEVRRYREDLARGKKEGKSESEAAKAAGRVSTGMPGLGKPGLKKKPVGPGAPVRQRPVGASARTGSVEAQSSDTAQAPREANLSQPSRPAARPQGAPPQPSYVTQSGGNETFVQNLIDGETDKPDFNPANKQKALNTISRIGSPEMKIFRIGTIKGKAEGQYYTQKEFLARNILGLPLWKTKAAEPEVKNPPAAATPEPEAQEVELVAVESSEVVVSTGE